jgi:hypothetical protein
LEFLFDFFSLQHSRFPILKIKCQLQWEDPWVQEWPHRWTHLLKMPNLVLWIVWWYVWRYTIVDYDFLRKFYKHCIMLYREHLAWAWFKLTMLVVIGTDCIGSCKSNYHAIMPTMAPLFVFETHVFTSVHRNLRLVGGFHRVLRFPPPIKLTATILLKYC